MARSPIVIRSNEDGISQQDLLMAGMSPEQVRIYRENAMQQATASTTHAKDHNSYRKQIAQEIHHSERLTNQALERLIKNASSQAGIDAGELLDFTLGKTKLNNRLAQQAGLKNSLTPMVLGLFVANVKQASKNFAGGISPRQVINQSRPVDIKRANEQIFLATTFKRVGNAIYWLTNAGPQDHLPPQKRVQNHKVVVELMDYPSLIVGKTATPSASEIRKVLENGKIKFDCDCGRHRYWYRYIASVGKFNFGAYENRYPSTRNPQLTGVACKHVLRVMHTLMSPYSVNKVKSYIEQDLKKGKGYGLSQRQSQAQILQEAQRQASPRHANHQARTIAKKIEKQLKQAIKEIKAKATKTERENYNALKTLQKNGIKLTKAMQAQIKDYESRYGQPK